MKQRPANYADWKHCIEVDCGIPLTAAFCQQRLEALNDERDPHTVAFRHTWGDDYCARVIGWFEQALATETGGAR